MLKETLTERLNVRLTRKERNLIRASAKRLKMSDAEYVRNCLKFPVKEQVIKF